MTKHEFENTNFKKGIRIEADDESFEIISVDFESNSVTAINGSGERYTIEYRELKYIK